MPIYSHIYIYVYVYVYVYIYIHTHICMHLVRSSTKFHLSFGPAQGLRFVPLAFLGLHELNGWSRLVTVTLLLGPRKMEPWR